MEKLQWSGMVFINFAFLQYDGTDSTKNMQYKLWKKDLIYVICIVLAYLISLLLSMLVHENVEYWLYTFPPVRFIDFFSGYALTKIYKEYSNEITTNDNENRYTVLERILLLSIVLLMVAFPYINVGFRRQALYLPFSCCLIFVVGMGQGKISKVLSSDWLVRIGNNSLYYYISHQVIYKWMYNCMLELP